MNVGELFAEAMDPVVGIVAAIMCLLLAMDALSLIYGP